MDVDDDRADASALVDYGTFMCASLGQVQVHLLVGRLHLYDLQSAGIFSR